MKELLKEDIHRYFRAAAFMLIAAAVLERCFGAACISRITIGLPCPACGMTRAALLFLSGRWRESFHIQPFFYALAAGIVFLFIDRYILKKDKCSRFLKYYAAVMLVALLVFYVYRMIRYFPDVPPMTYSKDSLLYHIFLDIYKFFR